MKRCPTCQTAYDDVARFCIHDGTRLVEATPGRAGPVIDAASLAPVEPPVAGHTAARPRIPPSRRESIPVPGDLHANLTGKMVDRRYRVERKLGEGGMAMVYLAIDVSTGERLAIKVLSASLSQDETSMARLRREASFGMRLLHPNICHIMRLGETEEGLVYIVMPFVDGEVLADRTYRLGQVPLADVLWIVRDVAAGLHAAHQLRIIHRDLKPENVMICRRPDGTEYAVVMDFGLAKERHGGVDAQKLTATGIVMGTPEFMSPEQLRGRPLDGRSDIYALALMTYEMLTGLLPFQGKTQQETMVARLKSDPPPMKRIRPDLDYPEAVERVIARGLARTPDERFPTAPEFANALAHAATGDAAPPQRESFLGRWLGR
ncbi:MAG TPA: serine/threonine-protein kinase [Gemmatimonadaceae bacterium]|nr:serine/threonine-protein kinase [Gemmatimonadaceae bacterium]